MLLSVNHDDMIRHIRARNLIMDSSRERSVRSIGTNFLNFFLTQFHNTSLSSRRDSVPCGKSVSFQARAEHTSRDVIFLYSDLK